MIRLSFLFSLILFPAALLGQAPGSAAAVSSEAATVQPKVPGRLTVPAPAAAPTKTNAPPPLPSGIKIDPLLDPTRPKNCQLEISQSQILLCGTFPVLLPPGTYKQILIVENPEGRKATGSTNLKPQSTGLGYIRYQSDAKLKIGDTDRTGGIDVPIRPEDHLPVRIWYKKMTEVDDLTKAFTFILPPVGLIAGAGAWSSGNFLIPEKPPVFSEARDYYLIDAEKKHTPPPFEVPRPATAMPGVSPATGSGLKPRN